MSGTPEIATQGSRDSLLQPPASAPSLRVLARQLRELATTPMWVPNLYPDPT